MPDPFDLEPHGGDDIEIEVIMSWLRTKDDLKSKVAGKPLEALQSEDDGGDGGGEGARPRARPPLRRRCHLAPSFRDVPILRPADAAVACRSTLPVNVCVRVSTRRMTVGQAIAPSVGEIQARSSSWSTGSPT